MTEFTAPITAIVERDSAEWVHMWQVLSSHPINQGDPACKNPVTGDCWQYMTSFFHEGGYIHEFRHRCHPKNGIRLNVHVPSSPGWSP